MDETSDKFYVDFSDRALLRLDGADGLDLLQRISTNDLSGLKVGEHVRTVLTTEKGRVVDILLVLRRSTNSLILAGQSRAVGDLANWIRRFIVMEDARLTLLNDDLIHILMVNLNDNELINHLTNHNFIAIQTKYSEVNAVHCIANLQARSHLESFQDEHGFLQADDRYYEAFRIQKGTPEYPNEVSQQFNPLELGLRSIVSFTKGCYVGQEVIARLDTYDKTLRTLRRLRLSMLPYRVPSELLAPTGEKAGILTSCVTSANPNEHILGIGIVFPIYDGIKLTYSHAGEDLSGVAEVIAGQ